MTQLKTCETCKFSVVFDRSIAPRSLGNLGCGWLNNELNVQEEVPQVEPDHTCHYWTKKDEEYDGNQESILHLVKPWSD